MAGVGHVVFKSIQYNPGIPERVGTVHTTIDGPSIHTISAIEDTQYSPTGIARVNQAGADKLESIYRNSGIISDFDDGINSFRGYLAMLTFISAFGTTKTYNFRFHVTGRIK